MAETKSTRQLQDLKAFVADQFEAVAVLREEDRVNEATQRFTARDSAVHAAMRYFDTFSAGQTPSVEHVIKTARIFERYFLET